MKKTVAGGGKLPPFSFRSFSFFCCLLNLPVDPPSLVSLFHSFFSEPSPFSSAQNLCRQLSLSPFPRKPFSCFFLFLPFTSLLLPTAQIFSFYPRPFLFSTSPRGSPLLSVFSGFSFQPTEASALIWFSAQTPSSKASSHFRFFSHHPSSLFCFLS